MATQGAKTVGDFLRLQPLYTPRRATPALIRCPTLVVDCEGDFASQGDKLYAALTCEKTLLKLPPTAARAAIAAVWASSSGSAPSSTGSMRCWRGGLIFPWIGAMRPLGVSANSGGSSARPEATRGGE